MLEISHLTLSYGEKRVLEDFQLIDYTLLCGAIGFDAVAGLSNKK